MSWHGGERPFEGGPPSVRSAGVPVNHTSHHRDEASSAMHENLKEDGGCPQPRPLSLLTVIDLGTEHGQRQLLCAHPGLDGLQVSVPGEQ